MNEVVELILDTGVKKKQNTPMWLTLSLALASFPMYQGRCKGPLPLLRLHSLVGHILEVTLEILEVTLETLSWDYFGGFTSNSLCRNETLLYLYF